jgi:hypothetical protein
MDPEHHLTLMRSDDLLTPALSSFWGGEGDEAGAIDYVTLSNLLRLTVKI